MSELLIALSFFTLGMLFGAVTLVVGVIWHGKRLMAKRKEGKAAEGKRESAESRLAKVKELTKQQFDMQSQAELPQRNATDGKYKNSLIHEIKRLEQEKTELLQSIIKDGLDPEVTVLNDVGEVKNMKLSEFMASMGIVPPPPEPKPTAKKIGKFMVYKGGKDDSGEGGGQTTH